MTHPAPRPFTLAFPDAALEDLRTRLALTRYPEPGSGAPWQTGTDLSWLRQLVDYWRDDFDWRAQEARLNAFPQYKVRLHGIDLHYLHVEGKGPAPMPLLLSHGWPGSVFEFTELIPRLTDPVRFGGRAEDAFTVIAPSLPGFGLSFEPGQPRFSAEQIADCFASLMTDVLGFQRFGAQGGDWGSFVTSRLAYAYPQALNGIHINFMPLRRDAGLFDATTDPDALRYADELKVFLAEEAGYQMIQGSRPQTLAYALTDSPAGLAAWVAEKFRGWSDCKGDVESVFTKDEILANISLYWLTGAIGSSFWPYYARAHGSWPIPPGSAITVPTAYCQFPFEILRPPRSLAARTYTNITRWTVMEQGGHFAAMEQPDALASDIRAFFSTVR